MNLAYFTNQYPAVSHTFIRREIEALEKLGLNVVRYALKSPQADLVDPEDKLEYARTRLIQTASVFALFAAVVKTTARHPLRSFKAFKMALKMGLKSDAGLVRHLFYLGEAMLLAVWCRRDGIDHLHVHFGTNAAAIAVMVKTLCELSYSLTIHGFEGFYRAPYLSLDVKLDHAVFVVCVSSYGRSQLMRVVDPCHWPKIEVVHCGLDDSFLRHVAAKFTGSHTFVCTGRLCAEKAQLVLVAAVARLRDEGINCRVILLGDGPMRREIDEAIAAASLGDRVFITGWATSEKIRSEIGAARAFVLPSFIENLPVSIMEAMALKRPIISTYIGGIPELVQTGETGWLVPASDVESLSNAMKQALALDHEKLEQMGAACRAAVLAKHDALKEASKLKTLFEHRTK